MDGISLKDCVLTEGSQVSRGFRFLMACEDYFHLFDRQALPVLNVVGSAVILDRTRIDVSTSGWVTVLKVASYFIAVLPLVVGVIVLIARTCYSHRSVVPTERPREENSGNDVNQILNGIHLGNGYSFLDCSGLQVDIVENGRCTGVRNTSNPMRFGHIITMCPVNDLADRAEGILDYQGNFQPLTQSLNQRGVQWFYAGRGISDISHDPLAGSSENAESRRLKWAALVHDVTFPESELSQYEPVGKTSEAYRGILTQKAEQLGNRIEQWFAPAFAILDRAVGDGERVLVHCSEGKSRSATVIVAYLINRYNLTVDQAIAFVRQQRPSVDVRFKPELEEYRRQLIY